MRVVPYSLKEKYSDKMPETEPTLNGMYYLAVVNLNVWVRAYKTVNGVEHFSGWTSKRTVIVR